MTRCRARLVNTIKSLLLLVTNTWVILLPKNECFLPPEDTFYPQMESSYDTGEDVEISNIFLGPVFPIRAHAPFSCAGARCHLRP